LCLMVNAMNGDDDGNNGGDGGNECSQRSQPSFKCVQMKMFIWQTDGHVLSLGNHWPCVKDYAIFLISRSDGQSAFANDGRSFLQRDETSCRNGAITWASAAVAEFGRVGCSCSRIHRVHPPLQLVLNDGARRGKALARQGDKLVPPSNAVFKRRQHLRPEWFLVGSVLK